jgi:hypothetical protein
MHLHLVHLTMLKLENAKFYMGFDLSQVFLLYNSQMHFHTFSATLPKERRLEFYYFYNLKFIFT